MDQDRLIRALDAAVARLSETGAGHIAFKGSMGDRSLPSRQRLGEFIDAAKAALFPGFYGIPETRRETIKYEIGHNLEAMHRILREQALYGLCFECEGGPACGHCDARADEVALAFLERLPGVREALSDDVDAAFDGDPAAKSHAEIIFCYPSIAALIHHRIAHELYTLKLPVIPRIISEMAHAATGIDIHPGAEIGRGFFIDHGTGVVIGETCVIGRNVRLYQGVTLGAKSFPKDEHGNPIKGIPRHPIVEDDVIIYAGATVLGRITIGAGSVIGGNTWVTESLPPGSKVSI
jgi:serine O-acetyltransferase